MQTKPANHLFDLYFEYVKDTESPLIFHRWSLIACVGAFLGRQYFFRHGTNRIFPNSYIMLIGNPGTRKSSAIKLCKKILSSAGYDKFAAERTTKEKFLLDLEGLPENYGDYNGTGTYGGARRRSSANESISAADVLRNLSLTDNEEAHDGTPREVFIAADEFNTFAGSGNLDFLALLGSLWDWDDESSSYKHRLKNSKSLSIYQPTISILGGNTHTGLQEGFPVQTLGQGFMSRLLLIHGEPSGRKIAFPTEPPEKLREAITGFFGQIKEHVQGEATITAQAKNMLQTIYITQQEFEDYRLKHYSTRRFTHLLKLVLTVSAMRLSTQIASEDVLLANTILTYTENLMPKALGEFGRSKNSEATQAVMNALYEAKEPLSFDALWRVVRRDLDKREQLSDILQGLVQADKVQMPNVKEHGKKAGFLPKQRPVNTQAVYVDFKLVQEAKGLV